MYERIYTIEPINMIGTCDKKKAFEFTKHLKIGNPNAIKYKGIVTKKFLL
jgi:hypothetical protein